MSSQPTSKSTPNSITHSPSSVGLPSIVVEHSTTNVTTNKTITNNNNNNNNINPNGTSSGGSMSSAMSSFSEPAPDMVTVREPGMSRFKQLLARRYASKHRCLGKKRRRLLEEAKERAKRSEYEVARLSSRLDILDLFVDHALVDDAFLGKKEMNPWRFKSPSMNNKYNFVNSMVTTQEMLVLIEQVKDKMKEKKDESSLQEETDKENNEERLSSCDAANETNGKGDKSKDPQNKKDIGILHYRKVKPLDNNNETLPKLVEEEGASKIIDEKKRVGENSSSFNKLPEVDDTNGIDTETPPETYNSPSSSSNPSKQPKSKRPKVKLRNHGKRKSAPNANILYAFGSTHNRENCQYCGNSLCVSQLSRNRLLLVQGGKALDSDNGMSDRIVDFQAIYEPDLWDSSKHSKTIQIQQQRIKTIDVNTNNKLVGSRASSTSSNSNSKQGKKKVLIKPLLQRIDGKKMM